MLSTSHDRFLFFCAHYITIRSFATRRCYRSYRDRHSPFARNLQAAFWLSCAHYIIIFSFSLLHSRTRAYALFRPASQPLSFLLRSLYYYQFCLSSKSSSVGSSGSSRNTVLIYLFISVRISLLLPSSGHIRLCVTHIRCTPCFLASSSKSP